MMTLAPLAILLAFQNIDDNKNPTVAFKNGHYKYVYDAFEKNCMEPASSIKIGNHYKHISWFHNEITQEWKYIEDLINSRNKFETVNKAVVWFVLWIVRNEKWRDVWVRIRCGIDRQINRTRSTSNLGN